MATKKKPAKRAKRKTTKPSRKPTRAAKRVQRFFEGRQAMIPGVEPRKPKEADTFTVSGVDGTRRDVTMPAVEVGHVMRRGVRARSSRHAEFSKRIELRVTPKQAEAYDRASALNQLAVGTWVRQVCDEAVAKLAGAK